MKFQLESATTRQEKDKRKNTDGDLMREESAWRRASVGGAGAGEGEEHGIGGDGLVSLEE